MGAAGSEDGRLVKQNCTVLLVLGSVVLNSGSGVTQQSTRGLEGRQFICLDTLTYDSRLNHVHNLNCHFISNEKLGKNEPFLMQLSKAKIIKRLLCR
jgi:hypothetical protein